MSSLSESIRRYGPSRRIRHVIYYLIGLVSLVVFYVVAYNYALARLEGVDQSIFASFEFVIQTMTTTGYGQDSDIWSHPLMFLFVALIQISGIAIGVFTLRLIIIPLFTGAEVNLADRLSPKVDHVIICEYPGTLRFSSTNSENSASITCSTRPHEKTPSRSRTAATPPSTALRKQQRRSSEQASTLRER